MASSSQTRGQPRGAGEASTPVEPVVRRRKPGGGRRRDPGIDTRVLHAARQVYAELGWAGFHFDRVAKRAEVSRDVLYRRYGDKAGLLLEALSDARLPTIAGSGDIYERILTYARDIYSYFTSPEGVASLRVHIEAAQFPELYRAYRKQVVDPNIEGNVTALESAVAEGRIGQIVDSAATFEAIGGAVMIHALYGQHSGVEGGASPADSAATEEAVQRIVATVLGNQGVSTPRR